MKRENRKGNSAPLLCAADSDIEGIQFEMRAQVMTKHTSNTTTIQASAYAVLSSGTVSTASSSHCQIVLTTGSHLQVLTPGPGTTNQAIEYLGMERVYSGPVGQPERLLLSSQDWPSLLEVLQTYTCTPLLAALCHVSTYWTVLLCEGTRTSLMTYPVIYSISRQFQISSHA